MSFIVAAISNIYIGSIVVDLDLRHELEDLMGDIQKRQRHIEDQMFLISILDRDGHNTVEQQAAVKFDASSSPCKWNGRQSSFRRPPRGESPVVLWLRNEENPPADANGLSCC